MKKIFFTSLFCLNLIFLSQVNAQEATLLVDKTIDNTIIHHLSQKNNLDTFYYNNGSIKEIRETINHKLNGSWKFFYTNGQLKKEGGFKNDKTQGIWKIYDKKGRLTFIESYNNGIENGIWKAFHSDGNIKIEGSFIKGKREGQWKIYKESGELEKIVTFENDLEKNELILDSNSIDINSFSIHQSISNY